MGYGLEFKIEQVVYVASTMNRLKRKAKRIIGSREFFVYCKVLDKMLELLKTTAKDTNSFDVLLTRQETQLLHWFCTDINKKTVNKNEKKITKEICTLLKAS